MKVLLPVVFSVVAALTPATWVGDSLSVIGDRTLQQVLLTGSHDSGSFYLTTDLMVGAAEPAMEALIELAEKLNVPIEDVITPWAHSQDQTFYEQMEGGIRYFDLRSGWDNVTQTWRAFHFESGLPIQSLVNDVRMFLLDHPSEIVIVEASHFWGNPTNAQIQLLADILMLELGDLMYPSDNGAFSLTIAQMVSTNQRAVVTMETIVGSYPKIFNGNVIYNTYANSDKLSAMVAFNLQTAQQYTNSTWPNQLFKLSWTLTPAADVILESVLIDHPHSLLDLADVANPHLPAFWQQVKTNGWKLGNIIIIDHYQASQILQVVLEANGITPTFLTS